MATRTLTRIFLAAVFGLSGLLAVLPPDNVRIFSENLGLQLLWDPPVNASNNLTYTTELKGSLDSSVFNPACVNQSETGCDVTGRITPYGAYTLRVRAELQEQASDWVTSNQFDVFRMSNISAPSVKLHSRRGEIEVQIMDPVMRLNDFQEMYRSVDYVISYWREGEDHRWEERSDQSHVILSPNRLTAHVSYCVQVHIFSPQMNYNVTSATSNHTCITNSANDTVAGWQIVLVMLGSFLVVGLSTLLLFTVGWYSYRGIHYLHPKAKLPEHFLIPSLLPPLTQMDQVKGQSVELCHPLSIVMETPQPHLLDGGVHCTSHTHPLLEERPEREGGRGEEQKREGGRGEEQRKEGGRGEEQKREGGRGEELERDRGSGAGHGALYSLGGDLEPCLPL